MKKTEVLAPSSQWMIGMKRNVKDVFVITGRNSAQTRAMHEFLRSIGLNPTDFNSGVSMVEEGSPFVGKIVDEALRASYAAVVILGPEDIVRLRGKFLLPHDPHYEQKFFGQARPNVLFEAGMAFALFPERTILVEMGKYLRPFSDVAGRHVVRLSNRVERRKDFIQRLRAVGCDVEYYDDSWKTAGDFTLDDPQFDIDLVECRYRNLRLVQGPARDTEGEEPDTRETRAAYRLVAYLAAYVIQRLEELDPFSELDLRQDTWRISATSRSIAIVAETLDGRRVSAQTDVPTDWHRGGTWELACGITADLVNQIDHQVHAESGDR